MAVSIPVDYTAHRHTPQAMVGTLCPSSGRRATRYESGRTCGRQGCRQILSIYNPGPLCEPCEKQERAEALLEPLKKPPMPVRQAARRVGDVLMTNRGCWMRPRDLLPYGTSSDVRRAVASLRGLGLTVEGRGGCLGGYRVPANERGGHDVPTGRPRPARSSKAGSACV